LNSLSAEFPTKRSGGAFILLLQRWKAGDATLLLTTTLSMEGQPTPIMSSVSRPPSLVTGPFLRIQAMFVGVFVISGNLLLVFL
jgi:hypothetical protein